MARASVVRKAGSSQVQAEAGADSLFSALDGQAVSGSGEEWVLEVAGIHRTPQDIFVQVAPPGEAGRGIVLRMPLQATASQALAALTAHLALPSEARGHVVDVMRVVSAGDPRPLRVS